MSDTIDDIDDEEDDSRYEWLELHYKACAICASSEVFFLSAVVMPAATARRPRTVDFVRFMPVVCQSCGYTIFVAAKFIEPKPLPEGADDA